jgi:hypothetical protein
MKLLIQGRDYAGKNIYTGTYTSEFVFTLIKNKLGNLCIA